jgi:AcrR family transcriptional regulator
MTSAARGRPRAEPRVEQQARIIRAARAAFTEHGYDSVTLSSIAQEAAVPRAVVYEVVGSKEHLLGAVADQVADELLAAVDTRFSDPGELDRPLDDVVRDDIRWFVELVAAEPSYSAIIRQSRYLASRGDDPLARARLRLEDRLTELHVARARSLGVEREATARVLSAAVLAMFEAVALRVGSDGWDTDAVAELIGEFAAGGYLRTELTGASEAFEERVRRS